MRSKSYCIEINPIPWQRARCRGKQFWDNQVKDKVSYGLIMQQQHGKEPLFKGPLRLDIVFYIRSPKARSKHASLWHTTWPDFDNFLKFICDAMNKVIIVDDKYICSGSFDCKYDPNPRTELTLTELE